MGVMTCMHHLTWIYPSLTDRLRPPCPGTVITDLSPRRPTSWRSPSLYPLSHGRLRGMASSSRQFIYDLPCPWGVLRPRHPLDVTRPISEDLAEWECTTISILVPMRATQHWWIIKSLLCLIIYHGPTVINLARAYLKLSTTILLLASAHSAVSVSLFFLLSPSLLLGWGRFSVSAGGARSEVILITHASCHGCYTYFTSPA